MHFMQMDQVLGTGQEQITFRKDLQNSQKLIEFLILFSIEENVKHFLYKLFHLSL